MANADADTALLCSSSWPLTLTLALSPEHGLGNSFCSSLNSIDLVGWLQVGGIRGLLVYQGAWPGLAFVLTASFHF